MPELYKFQQKALADLLDGKHVCLLNVGCGKSAVSIRWAREVCVKTGKKKLVVVTTASKKKSGDYLVEADTWAGEDWRRSLEEFEVITWHVLKKWVDQHWASLADHVFIFDEIAKAKSGVSSQMGRAFLRITGQTKNWTGYTATPGDAWLSYYPYFQATGLVRNKTAFKARYVSETFYKGYPDIIGYRHEDELLHMWKKISTAPDTSALYREMPSETTKVVLFKKPQGYDKLMKTRMTPDGEWLDTTMKLCHTLRQDCFTKGKQQWVIDFLEGLGTNAVIFYTYKEEGDILCDIGQKALPKGSKVWRIDGAHHDIPTASTIGKNDVVLCQWQSGSEALNLQFINYWVATTPQYSYSTFVQAKGRINRIGQKRPMFYYLLKCERTIEEDIYKAIATKQDFAELAWATDNNLTVKENDLDRNEETC